MKAHLAIVITCCVVLSHATIFDKIFGSSNEIGAILCNGGPNTKICLNSETCCETKYEAAGEYMCCARDTSCSYFEDKNGGGKTCCCPDGHECQADGSCAPKKVEVTAYWCDGPYSALCHNDEECCETKHESPGDFLCCAKNTTCSYFNDVNGGGKTCCCPDGHECQADGSCSPKQEVTAFYCDGPYSQLCMNSDTCCETKFEAAGEFMCCAHDTTCSYFNDKNGGGKTCCCPDGHECQADGSCAPKQEVSAYMCNGLYTKICHNSETCCETKYEAIGEYICCAHDTTCSYFNDKNGGGKTCCCPDGHECQADGSCAPKLF